MRRITKIICLSAGLTLSLNVFGQIADSLPQREDIVGEILVDIYRTKIPSAIEMGLDFASYWDAGGLSTQQKNKIERIYQKMKERKMPPNPYLLYFIKTISLAGGNELIQLSAMTQIVDMTEQVLTYESALNIRNYFQNLNTFLAHKAIYYSNGYKLLVDNIDFEFGYAVSKAPEIIEPVPQETEKIEEEKIEDQDNNSGSWNDWDNDNWDNTDNSNSDPDG